MGRVNVEAARNVGSEPCLTLSGRMQGNRAPDPTGAVGPKFGTSLSRDHSCRELTSINVLQRSFVQPAKISFDTGLFDSGLKENFG
jgi:hypothetical protein